ncbi:hypothetical protein [Metallosphaera hakonensis]|uniref:Uncharacterized protein n=1 Tax=Metallosphaera hakonensis JCM 8857 = DSM 7519 TaxID=1293036 RepID=A0A2U9ISL2_9CREN|nr:hypothetical protein [Metallosphaera hakonensis]AWR98943.1 hypothetical protein DFR87_03680 [Metallosphaera hakonensis JCM 8857 = DSM 7519]
MNKISIVLIVLAVVIIVGAVVLIYRDHGGSAVLTSPVGSQINLPTQAEIQQVAPGWRVISMGEINSSQVLSGLYPNADSLYQEYIQAPGVNGSLVSISIIHYPGKPNSTESLPHVILGNYVIEVNSTGNVSPTTTQGILSLAKSVFNGHNGTPIEIPSFIYPSSPNLPLVEYVVDNITSQQGNFTQYSAYFVASTAQSGESVGVDVLHGLNSTKLYNYLYSTTVVPASGNTSSHSLAVNGTLNGARYFNLSINGTFGETFYYVGLKGNYVVLIQAQPSSAFQIFEYIIEKL